MIEINRESLTINGTIIRCEINNRLEVVYKGDEYQIVDFIEKLINDTYYSCIEYEKYLFFKTNKILLKDRYKAEKLLNILNSIGNDIYVEGADYKRTTLDRIIGGDII